MRAKNAWRTAGDSRSKGRNVKIASTPEEFVASCEEALELSHNPERGWLAEADLMLSATSWDTTQARMAGLIADILGVRTGTTSPALLVAAE